MKIGALTMPNSCKVDFLRSLPATDLPRGEATKHLKRCARYLDAGASVAGGASAAGGVVATGGGLAAVGARRL